MKQNADDLQHQLLGDNYIHNYNSYYEHFTGEINNSYSFYVFPLWFLVISAVL